MALQLGGSEPADLARCARLGADWGYDEINLNCGCPSERVQKGAFGACLMREPELVADCVRAMREAVSIPVSVKHRLGVDHVESFDFVQRFVETVARAGCGTFIVHARNAILKGLSPKDESHRAAAPVRRRVPAEAVVPGARHRAERRRRIGRRTIDAHLARVDGVMLGRAAYHDSYLLAEADARLFGGVGASPRGGGACDGCLRASGRCARARRCARSPGTCSVCITASRERAHGAACCPTRRAWHANRRSSCSKRWRSSRVVPGLSEAA